MPTCSPAQSLLSDFFFFFPRLIVCLCDFSEQGLDCVQLIAVRPLEDLCSAARTAVAQSRAAKARTGSSGGSGAGRKQNDSVEDKPISLGSSGERNRAERFRAHFQTKESPLLFCFLSCCCCFFSLHLALWSGASQVFTHEPRHRPCQRPRLPSQMFPEPVRRAQVTARRSRKSQVRCDRVGFYALTVVEQQREGIRAWKNIAAHQR